MNNDILRKKVNVPLIFVLVIALALTPILPTTYNEVKAEESDLGVKCGEFMVTGNSANYSYSVTNKTLTITSSVSISMASEGAIAESDIIIVSPSGTAVPKVVLSGVSIKTARGEAVSVLDKTKIILSGTNRLETTSNNNGALGAAQGKTIIIDDNGGVDDKLIAFNSGYHWDSISAPGGDIIIDGGKIETNKSIGSENGKYAKSITINGGDIDCQGELGYQIDTIDINGGTVNSPECIGESTRVVNINGGIITAEGIGYESNFLNIYDGSINVEEGIGEYNSFDTTGSSIVISGGSITAATVGYNTKKIEIYDGTINTARIGGDRDTKNIEIHGGVVNLNNNGEYYRSGIECGNANLLITGGIVNVNDYDIGIACGGIEINGGNVIVKGYGGGIRTGSNDLTINGGLVSISAIDLCGIFSNANLIINDGTVKVNNESASALAISDEFDTKLEINGGIVDVKSEYNHAAIFADEGNKIIINGGFVTADGADKTDDGYKEFYDIVGDQSDDIGRGVYSIEKVGDLGSEVQINGGSVWAKGNRIYDPVNELGDSVYRVDIPNKDGTNSSTYDRNVTVQSIDYSARTISGHGELSEHGMDFPEDLSAMIYMPTDSALQTVDVGSSEGYAFVKEIYANKLVWDSATDADSIPVIQKHGDFLVTGATKDYVYGAPAGGTDWLRILDGTVKVSMASPGTTAKKSIVLVSQTAVKAPTVILDNVNIDSQRGGAVSIFGEGNVLIKGTNVLTPSATDVHAIGMDNGSTVNIANADDGANKLIANNYDSGTTAGGSIDGASSTINIDNAVIEANGPIGSKAKFINIKNSEIAADGKTGAGIGAIASSETNIEGSTIDAKGAVGIIGKKITFNTSIINAIGGDTGGGILGETVIINSGFITAAGGPTVGDIRGSIEINGGSIWAKNGSIGGSANSGGPVNSDGNPVFKVDIPTPDPKTGNNTYANDISIAGSTYKARTITGHGTKSEHGDDFPTTISAMIYLPAKNTPQKLNIGSESFNVLVNADGTSDIDWNDLNKMSVTLDKSTLTMDTSKTQQLKATISPQTLKYKDITWSSSNESIASVSQTGVITAKKTGKVTITARSKANTDKFATATVTVVPETTRIATAQKTVYLKKGGSFKIGAMAYTKTGEKTKLTYKSSNTKIATVSSAGKIKAKNTGKVTITITAENGKSFKVNIKVVKKAKKVKKITLTKAPKSIKRGKSVFLKAKINPASATGVTVKFKSNKPRIASVDKAGRLIAKKKGTVKIKVTAGGKSKTYKIRVK